MIYLILLYKCYNYNNINISFLSYLNISIHIDILTKNMLLKLCILSGENLHSSRRWLRERKKQLIRHRERKKNRTRRAMFA